MPQLDPTWFASQIFWLAVSLVLLYFLLARLVLPRLNAVLETREKARLADLAAAEQLNTKAKQASEQYERAMNDARAGARQVFQEAETSIRQITEAADQQLKAQLETRSQEAEASLAKKLDALRVHLGENNATLAAEITEKLSGKRPAAAQAEQALRAADSAR